MEMMMAAGIILNPVGLFICMLIPAIAIYLARGPRLSATRLAAGYLGALCVLAIGVVASSYISPEEAVSVWHVAPDHYWHELIELYLSTFAVTGFACIVGISCVGLPVLVGLSKVNMATAPWLILASVAIFMAFAVVSYAPMYLSSDVSFLGLLGHLVGSHAAVSVASA